MAEHTFGVLLKWNPELSPWLMDAIRYAGCDDAQVDMHEGCVRLTFVRESPNVIAASHKAIMSLKDAGIKGANYCEPAPLVRPAEVLPTSQVQAPEVPQDLSGVAYETLHLWRGRLTEVIARIYASMSANEPASFASLWHYADWRKRAAIKKKFCESAIGRIRAELSARASSSPPSGVKNRLYPLLWKFFDSFRHLDDAPPEMLLAAENLVSLLHAHGPEDGGPGEEPNAEMVEQHQE